ncbi:hypothetical protein [uncultured Dokdonia sp.]|uniref:hypothetical protein n=1 Tax=uncultured Dokdonia sp. TaxID=575653 RepID=UPI002637E8DF|nr:hypothetical protein [uncultured Dokdonia sp.]
MSKKLKVHEVFGQSRKIPLNYIERPKVDEVFRNSLKFNKHLVIYGSSKQGKTSLRKYNLEEEKYISVHCSNIWDIGQLNAQILKRAGFELTVSSSKTIDGKAKVKADFNLFTFLKAGGEIEEGESENTQQKPLELDIYDSNDIISALKSIDFDKYIILEDFHYLKEEVQTDFAFELKAFHENSNYTFIIVGVWLEDNRLTLLNGDLAGRIYAINADSWSSDQLKRVINKGAELLNISFINELTLDIIKWSLGSVFICQEICLQICISNGIDEKQFHLLNITKEIDVYEITKRIINQQTGRYNAFLRAFYYGFQSTDLEMHKWLMYPILKAKVEDLTHGLSYKFIKDTIREKHPRKEKLNLGNLTGALNSAASLQIKKNIKPNIIDYDQTNLILNIVDKGFLIWLIFQKKAELLESIELPI